MDSQAIKNRLLKNYKKLKSYLDKNKIEAYRLYNKDIPEIPYIIDIYKNHAIIFEQGKRLGDEDQFKRSANQKVIQIALSEAFLISTENQHYKVREIQKGNDQYQPTNPLDDGFFSICEGELKFLVNLERYLDTGLFLDHRPLRKFLTENSQGKKILNLFCYTGSLSIAAAVGGGVVTSIDMSRTYLDWAYENFLLNNLDAKAHVFYQADVLKELKVRKDHEEKFDLIILDPPSFSNSKRMEDDLDIERDHPILIRDSMNLLSRDGALYFSTNKRRFELHPIITSQYEVKEITQWTIPQDFYHSNIHRAFAIKHKQL